MSDVCRRMLRFLRLIVRRHAGETVVMVSHADPITILRLTLEDMPMTVGNLHAAVYAARASVLQIEAGAAGAPRLTYFDIVGEGAT